MSTKSGPAGLAVYVARDPVLGVGRNFEAVALDDHHVPVAAHSEVGQSHEVVLDSRSAQKAGRRVVVGGVVRGRKLVSSVSILYTTL
jgi:hypothetical protein